MPPRRPDEYLPPGYGEQDIPYDRSSDMSSEGISGIPSAVGGMKKMSLEFAEPSAPEAPQIPPGAGVPPTGMQGAVPPAGMQAPSPDQGASPFLAGMGPQEPQGFDSSMLSTDDLMSMQDPTAQQGQQLFQQSMEDPQAQQQLLLAAKRMMGGGGF